MAREMCPSIMWRMLALRSQRTCDMKLEITDDAIVIQGERSIEQEKTKKQPVCDRTAVWQVLPNDSPVRRRKDDSATGTFKDGVAEITVATAEQKSTRRETPIQGSYTEVQRALSCAGIQQRNSRIRVAQTRPVLRVFLRRLGGFFRTKRLSETSILLPRLYVPRRAGVPMRTSSFG